MNKKIYSFILIAIVLTIGFAIIEAMRLLVGTMDLQFNLGYHGSEIEVYFILLVLISPLIVQPHEVLCCLEKYRSSLSGTIVRLMKH